MMRRLSLVLASALIGGTCHAEDISEKWFCVTESAAGSLWNENAQQYIPRAINFQEGHKKFLLEITQNKPYVAFCKQTLDHWEPILLKDGKFEYSSTMSIPRDDPNNPKNNYDFRENIGPNCFSTTQATLKFFDRDYPDIYHGYDFDPRSFTGLPGNWFSFYGNRFQAGETLDAGPVVFTGSCQKLDTSK